MMDMRFHTCPACGAASRVLAQEHPYPHVTDVVFICPRCAEAGTDRVYVHLPLPARQAVSQHLRQRARERVNR
jgi:C4-type Zn-finger protein